MLEHQLPRIVRSLPTAADDSGLALGQIEAHGMALEAVDAAFALLKVHRVARQVPVIDAIAIGMEVQPFLADRRGGEN